MQSKGRGRKPPPPCSATYGSGQGIGHLVDQGKNGTVGNLGVEGKADLAGLAGGIARLAAMDLLFEAIKCRLVELWEIKAPISGKSAAEDILRHHHLMGTELGQLAQLAIQSHLTGTAGGMDGNPFFLAGKDETIQKKFKNELDRFIEAQPFIQGGAHPLQAGTGITEHRQLTISGGLEQGCAQFLGLAVGLFFKALAFKGLTTAEAIDIVGKDDAITALGQNGQGLLRQRGAVGFIPRRSAHGPAGTTGKIDHQGLIARRDGNRPKGRHAGRHLPVPQRHMSATARAHHLGGLFHQRGAGKFMQPVHGLQKAAHRTGHSFEVIGNGIGHRVGQLAMRLLAQTLDHLAGIDPTGQRVEQRLSAAQVSIPG